MNEEQVIENTEQQPDYEAISEEQSLAQMKADNEAIAGHVTEDEDDTVILYTVMKALDSGPGTVLKYFQTKADAQKYIDTLGDGEYIIGQTR